MFCLTKPALNVYLDKNLKGLWQLSNIFPQWHFLFLFKIIQIGYASSPP